jgi:hypothetical protein
MTKQAPIDIEAIIEQAVYRERLASQRQPKDAYKATESRLYAYPVLLEKMASDAEELEQARRYGLPHRSKDIVRFSKSGSRIDPQEAQEALEQDIKAGMAANQHEIDTIDRALTIINGDTYADIIPLKYFQGQQDEQIAKQIGCDATTIWRNKTRLVKKLSVFLYGVSAVV